MSILLFDLLRYTYRWLRHSFKIYEPEEKIIADAQRYWNNADEKMLNQYTHNRDAGVFKDDKKMAFYRKTEPGDLPGILEDS